MKLLSIIVPIYNSEKWLPKCLESLVNQDIDSKEYEIILVNDGSPDNSRVIAIEYAEKYSNIIVLERPNGGTSAARNTGIHAASGKYIYFVDPDDYVLENSLHVLLEKMEREKLDILRFAYFEVNEEGKEISSVKHPDPIDYSPKIMDGCSFMAERLGASCFVWTYLFKASIIKDNNIYFGEGVYFDDTPWLPQVLAKAKRVDSMDYKRHFYLIRSDSLVRNKEIGYERKKIAGQQYLIRELLRQTAASDNVFAKKWYGLMLSHCVLGLLSLVGECDFSRRSDYIRELSNLNVFPLSKYRLSRRNRIKIAIVNISPSLFCLYCHIRTF